MKTLTEFNPLQIQQGLKKKADFESALRAASKAATELGTVATAEKSVIVETSPSETPVAEISVESSVEETTAVEAAPTEPAPEAPSLETAFTEAFKYEGDKLKFFINALDIAKKRPNGIKRVVVLTLAETDKAPAGAEKRDEHHYLVEYFPQSAREAARAAQGRGDRNDRGGKRGGRDGKRGGGRDGKGRGDAGSRGPREPRAPRSPETTGVIVVNVAGAPGAATGEQPRGPRKPRPPRAPRAPRPPREPRPAGPAPTSNLMIRMEGGKVVVAPKENAPVPPASAPASVETSAT